MGNVICLGINRYNYTTYKLEQALKRHSVSYSYYNIFDIVEKGKEVANLQNAKVIFTDDGIIIGKEDFDNAIASSYNSSSESMGGKIYNLLRKNKTSFFNNIDNHFRVYNKRTLYNLLLMHNINYPASMFVGRTTDIKESRVAEFITQVGSPFYIRSVIGGGGGEKYSFISTGLDDLFLFYDELISAKDSGIFALQKYIPHDFFITANVTYNNIRYFMCSNDRSIYLPVHEEARYNSFVYNIKNKLKLNCFSVSFVELSGKNIVLQIKVPGEISLTDMIFNVDVCDEIVKGFIGNAG